MASEPDGDGTWRQPHAAHGSAVLPLACLFVAAIAAFVATSLHLNTGRDVWIAAGLILALVYAVVAIRMPPHALGFGYANGVTAIRAAMVSYVGATVLFGDSFGADTRLSWALVLLVAVALALDGVDGFLARRLAQTSAFGARFDMEIDAFLILVLSVFVAGTFGWWTVAIGAFRYLFVAASWLAPWLTAPLPPKFSRKTVAATQGVVLVVATAHILPDVIAFAGLAVALVSLTWSFARDIAWLWRSEQLRRAAAARTELPIVPSRRRVLRTPAAVG